MSGPTPITPTPTPAAAPTPAAPTPADDTKISSARIHEMFAAQKTATSDTAPGRALNKALGVLEAEPYKAVNKAFEVQIPGKKDKEATTESLATRLGKVNQAYHKSIEKPKKDVDAEQKSQRATFYNELSKFAEYSDQQADPTKTRDKLKTFAKVGEEAKAEAKTSGKPIPPEDGIITTFQEAVLAACKNGSSKAELEAIRDGGDAKTKLDKANTKLTTSPPTNPDEHKALQDECKALQTEYDAIEATKRANPKLNVAAATSLQDAIDKAAVGSDEQNKLKAAQTKFKAILDAAIDFEAAADALNKNVNTLSLQSNLANLRLKASEQRAIKTGVGGSSKPEEDAKAQIVGLADHVRDNKAIIYETTTDTYTILFGATNEEITNATLAMIEVKGRHTEADGGKRVDALVMSQGSSSARLNVCLTALSCAVTVRFDDTPEYKRHAENTDRASGVALFAQIFGIMANLRDQMKKESGAVDDAKLLAQTYMHSDVSGQRSNTPENKMGKSFEAKTKCFWEAMVHGEAGKDGITVTEVLKNIYLESKAQADKVDATLPPAEQEKKKQDIMNRFAVHYSRAEEVIGREKLNALLFNKDDNVKVLSPDALAGIAATLLKETKPASGLDTIFTFSRGTKGEREDKDYKHREKIYVALEGDALKETIKALGKDLSSGDPNVVWRMAKFLEVWPVTDVAGPPDPKKSQAMTMLVTQASERAAVDEVKMAQEMKPIIAALVLATKSKLEQGERSAHNESKGGSWSSKDRDKRRKEARKGLERDVTQVVKEARQALEDKAVAASKNSGEIDTLLRAFDKDMRENIVLRAIDAADIGPKSDAGWKRWLEPAKKEDVQIATEAVEAGRAQAEAERTTARH